ncbi:hypothetical protein [Terrihabitans rhizophilus]|jgi:pectin methylesterase-like acyl-CoA thioesterase|uniref:Uncharacterized protein n=1 Tax=Terrihabitans rhizophilus TaxID=3092662 RepID=A0ABU4RM50_9HYPH|nr:hypothetical protein [Terrihabitans sp. PJ23]MDX6805308.1 hypothetical protein [Terrihabitans sp. PJ23]
MAVVSAITLTAWTYADQARMAKATPVADVTPAATSITTNSNLSAKGDALSVAPQLAADTSMDGGEAFGRIVGAHQVAMSEHASKRFVTVAKAGVSNETVLTRVRVSD